MRSASSPRAARGSLARLAPYAVGVWPLLATTLVCILAASLLELAVPWVMGFLLLDTVVKDARLDQLPRVVFLLVAIFLGQKGVGFLQDYFEELANQRLVHRLRCDLFHHLQHLPVRFFDRGRTGELTARVTSDIDSVEGFLPTLVDDVVTDAVLLLGTLYFLFRVDRRLTLYVAPTILAMAFTLFLFKPRVRRFAHRVRAMIGDLAAIATETLAGVRVVKGFVGEAYEDRRFEAQSLEVLRARVGVVRLRSLSSATVDLGVLLGTIIVVSVAAPRVVAGTFSVGALVAYLGYLNKLYGPAKRLSKVNVSIQKIVAAAERIFGVMELAPEERIEAAPAVRPARAPRVSPESAPGVRFEHVTFSYGDERPALRDLTLDVAPGEAVALVGRSGAGKTTVVNLLLRFYTPASGRILLDGVPLDQIPLPELRGQIGLVSQDVFLFSGTIRDNIAYALPAATDEDVVEAARQANAHDFISQLPKGYASTVGERGVQLSGGQRQRIAIARAWLRRPRLLVLDEATSHLDSESERHVQEAFDRVSRGRTVFLIAHRLSTLWNADKIVVIENGTIVQVGRHEELLQSPGIYRRLYRLQQRAGAEEPERRRESRRVTGV
jgi:ATP-binding cassette, subfamily B, bacterial MsbA